MLTYDTATLMRYISFKITYRNILYGNRFICHYAATSGNLDILENIHCEKNYQLIVYEAIDHIHVLEYLHKYYDITEDVLLSGNLNAIKWLNKYVPYKRCDLIAVKNNLDVVMWFYDVYPDYINKNFAHAVCSNLYILKWLNYVKPELITRSVFKDANVRNKKLMRWYNKVHPEYK